MASRALPRVLTVALALGLVVAGPLTAQGRGASPPADVVVVRSLPLRPAGKIASNSAPSRVAPTASTCVGAPRATLDRPDLDPRPSLHVIYLVAADATDEELDVNGVLACSLQAQNAWLEQQSGFRWRLDTFAHEVRTRDGRKRLVPRLDVTFIRSDKPAAELDGAFAIRDELVARGFQAAHKRYLTFAVTDYTAMCGDAIYPISVHASQRRDGKYAQVYLSSDAACHATEFGSRGQPSWAEAIAQQELLHTEGLAPIGAPHSCPMVLPFAHVCTGALHYTEGSVPLDPERQDVLYPYVSLPLAEKILDIGRDDYFAHDLPIGDLEDSVYLTRD